jgi:predicted dinucleotide-binding enzyme
LVGNIDGSAKWGSFEDAASHGEVILLAIPLNGTVETFPLVLDHVQGKIVVDAMNFFEERDRIIAEEIGKFSGTHSAYTASKIPGTHLVKAFNTIYFKTLETKSGRGDNRLAVPVAGDDGRAKAVVKGLVDDAGFDPCDVGTLEDSAVMQPGELLWTRELTLPEMNELLTTR